MGKIILFIGYAGAGKNTIINELMKLNKDYGYIPSTTTRKMRRKEGEQEGKPYYFTSLDDFQKLESDGYLLESEEIHGNYYGTSKVHYEKALQEGRTVLKDIGVRGAGRLKELYGNSVTTIFIEPKSIEDIVERMRSRGESEEEIRVRQQTANFEKMYRDKYDFIVVNDKLEDAVRECKGIIEGK